MTKEQIWLHFAAIQMQRHLKLLSDPSRVFELADKYTDAYINRFGELKQTAFPSGGIVNEGRQAIVPFSTGARLVVSGGSTSAGSTSTLLPDSTITNTVRFRPGIAPVERPPFQPGDMVRHKKGDIENIEVAFCAKNKAGKWKFIDEHGVVFPCEPYEKIPNETHTQP